MNCASADVQEGVLFKITMALLKSIDALLISFQACDLKIPQSHVMIYKQQPNYFFFSMTVYRVGALYSSLQLK